MALTWEVWVIYFSLKKTNKSCWKAVKSVVLAGGHAGRGEGGAGSQHAKKECRSPDHIDMGLSDCVRGNVRGATGDTSVKQAATLFGRYRTSSTWSQWRRTAVSVASAVAAADCTLTFPVGGLIGWRTGRIYKCHLQNTQPKLSFVWNWV